ncbi:MAG: GNAT family N-acetyltransferase [Candidatus Saccharibacteria bacterium]
MFGPMLPAQNERAAIMLAPIDLDDLPEEIDPAISEHLTDTFDSFLGNLPEHYAWLRDSEDNMHWGIYNDQRTRLLGITGVRNIGAPNEPAISRIALFDSATKGQGIGALAYQTQYDHLLKTSPVDIYEHAAANANRGSLKIARRVGFVAVHDNGVRTTMCLRRAWQSVEK